MSDKYVLNLWSSINATLLSPTKIQLLDATQRIYGPVVIAQSRSRLCGSVTAFIKRRMEWVLNESHCELVKIAYTPVYLGSMINQQLPVSGKFEYVSATSRYTKEVIQEMIARGVTHANTAAMHADRITAIGPDFLIIDVEIKEPDGTPRRWTVELDIDKLSRYQQYAKPDADNVYYWVMYSDAATRYEKNVADGEHDDFVIFAR